VATNWDKVTAAIKGAWVWVTKMAQALGAFSMEKLSALMNIGRPAGATQAKAQAQGSRTNTNRTVNNSANTTVNINGQMPTPQQAKGLGRGFAAGSLRGFQALEAF
jgi:hypothetical protein